VEKKMARRNASRQVVVAGDVTIDWNLARAEPRRGRASGQWIDDTIRVFRQRGGAALLADSLAAIATRLSKDSKASCTIHQPNLPDLSSAIGPDDPRFHHFFAIWSSCKYAATGQQEASAWRVIETLGLQRAKDGPGVSRQSDLDIAEPDLIVLVDDNLGFREQPGCWPMAMGSETPKRPWVMLKMAAPVAQGSLWERLSGQHPDRLVVITTVNDVRLSAVQISRGLSWERTAQDIYWELVHNPSINSMSRCAHVVVSFGAAGAVLLSRADAEQAASRCFLFFDPQVSEGEWEMRHPGGMVGGTSCLAAGIVRQFMVCPEEPDIARGIQGGLAALRTLHQDGYGERGKSLGQVEVFFPVERIAAILSQTREDFAAIEVQDPVRFLNLPSGSSGKPASRFWTILQDRYRGNLNVLAEQLVIQGPEAALEGVPLGRFGQMLTIDRHEIESFRSVRALMQEYVRAGNQKTPLSIAVFGAPGSGKSFGIIQIANSLMPGQVEVKEFNLSQLDSPQELHGAFHQVRDVGLSRKMPLVVWDEFDTALGGAPLGWLRYFLAPMQDGKFQEGQISHPLGKSIFVFAGGTVPTMADFGQGLSGEQFRLAKGPDFVSRLKGSVDILGPNPVGSPEIDPYFILRRAILIRSILQRTAPQLFGKKSGQDILDIDPGVLRALLNTPQYRHGIRSIVSIVAMSQLAEETSFERSALPPESQLEMHVDGEDFMALVHQIVLEGEPLEALARAAHEVFCDGMRRRGYKWGPRTDEKKKMHMALVDYAELPPEMKQSNRDYVRDIPTKLARIGCIMMPARSGEPASDFLGEGLLEALAEMEHERWVRARLADGWSHGDVTDPQKKVHRALVPWDALVGPDLESEREKDLDLVRGIPEILARAGYAIVKATDRPA
jgi:hypothetical protein